MLATWDALCSQMLVLDYRSIAGGASFQALVLRLLHSLLRINDEPLLFLIAYYLFKTIGDEGSTSCSFGVASIRLSTVHTA